MLIWPYNLLIYRKKDIFKNNYTNSATKFVITNGIKLRIIGN